MRAGKRQRRKTDRGLLPIRGRTDTRTSHYASSSHELVDQAASYHKPVVLLASTEGGSEAVRRRRGQAPWTPDTMTDKERASRQMPIKEQCRSRSVRQSRQSDCSFFLVHRSILLSHTSFGGIGCQGWHDGKAYRESSRRKERHLVW